MLAKVLQRVESTGTSMRNSQAHSRDIFMQASMNARIACPSIWNKLFLDVYAFDFNEYENPGTKELYAVWDEERYALGTEANRVSAISKIQCIDDLFK